MRETGVLFDELPVVGDAGPRATNEVCEKLDERRYRIDGREVGFPVRVNRAAMLLNAFLVDARVAQQMLEGSGFRVAELLPGKAVLQLALIDYRENDLGDYNEAAINFPVLTPGQKKPFPFFGTLAGVARGSLASFVYRMPVDQEFTTHAGRFIWGFPKWVTRIDIDFGAERASGSFIDEAEPVFSIAAKAGGRREQPEQRIASLAIRDGRAWKTQGSSAGSGLTVGLGGELPTIGEKHPLALELRALGLPKRPLFSISVRELRMRFEPPESVAIGSPFQR